jgi:L-fucose isomerase
MRSTPIGIAMLNDEREHVWRANNPANEQVVRRWSDLIRARLRNVDGSAPEVVVGSRIITGVRVDHYARRRAAALQIGRASCRERV